MTLTLVRELPVFLGSQRIKSQCLSIVRESFRARNEAITKLQEAESILLDAINLKGWRPFDPLTYSYSSADAFMAGRLDAEYFKPMFAELETHLYETGSFATLGPLLLKIDRGMQPIYSETGLCVINSQHVRRNEVQVNSDNRRASGMSEDACIRKGDVLINGTGVGTIGRSAAYLHEQLAIPDNHVTVLRIRNDAIDPVFLAVQINSVIGELQVLQHRHGSSGQLELYPSDIANFLVWIAPEDVQTMIRRAVEESFKAKQRAESLLGIATRAVEIAIEEHEEIALKFLQTAHELN